MDDRQKEQQEIDKYNRNMTYPVGKREIPKGLASVYDEYTWSGVSKKPAFAYDDTSEWAALASHLISGGWNHVGTLPEPRLRAQEKENIDKIGVCWRLVGYGQLYEPDARVFTTRNRPQAEMIRPMLKRRRAQYIAWLRSQTRERIAGIMNGAPVRIDRGKGAPYWSPSSDKTVVFAYARLAQSARTYAELERSVCDAGHATQRFMQTSYIRVQGARKRRPVWTPVAGGLQTYEDAFLPKVRRIGAMPFAINHLMVAVGYLLRTAMAEIDDRNTGTVAPAAKAVAQFRYNAALDFSSYDQTVGLESLEAVDGELFFPILDWLFAHGYLSGRMRMLIADVAYHINYMSIILPPRTVGEAAYIASATGQTRSGIQLTSWYGTEINRNYCLARLLSMGRDPDVVRIYNYGDDTIMATDDASAIDEWAADTDAGGFKTTVAPDATFLMRRLPDDYGYLGRMLAATVNREPQHEPSSVIAAASAFATRHAMLQGHPAADAYLDVLSEWDRGPRRFTAAVSMARKWKHDPVALNQLAMQYTMSTQSTLSTESMEQQISSLVKLDYPGATQLQTTMTNLLTTHKRTIPWAAFQRQSAALSIKEAARVIRSRSYTIGMFK